MGLGPGVARTVTPPRPASIAPTHSPQRPPSAAGLLLRSLAGALSARGNHHGVRKKRNGLRAALPILPLLIL